MQTYGEVHEALRARRAASLVSPPSLVGACAAARAPSNSSTVAVYGFVGWLLSYVLLCGYLLWAFVPDAALRAAGIAYMPSKYWALALPTWACMTLAAVPLVYRLLCLATVPDLDDVRTVSDRHTRRLQPALHGSPAVPPLADVPIGRVNRILYDND